MSFHTQMDWQTERVQALLEEYLLHFVSANQRDWVHHLDVAQFCYNLQKSESAHHSPFKIMMGRQPLASAPLWHGETSKSLVNH